MTPQNSIGQPYKRLLIVALFISITANIYLVRFSLRAKTTNEYQPPEDTVTKKIKVGWITVGLGNGYRTLATDFFASSDKYFCASKRHLVQVDYILFSDTTTETSPPSTVIYKKKMGWPKDSDQRYAFIIDHAEELQLHSYTYLFWSDADQLFVDYVCEDIMGTLVGASHGHYNDAKNVKWPYEDRPQSQAFVPEDNRYKQPYFSAHLYGGTALEFLKMVRLLQNATEVDHSNGIQAKVDDESYLNRYFYDNPPSVTLSTGFVHPERKEMKPKKFIIARHLDKKPRD